MDLASLLDDMRRRIGELERRQRGLTRTGVITAINAADGRVRVRITGGGTPLITGWIPWEESAAGAAKTHIPPSVGQQVRVRSESGDLTDATVQGSVNSEANARPASAGNEYVILQVGAARIAVTGGGNEIVFEVGASALRITDAGIVAVAPRIDLN
ncbi:phage baseplate assembly protein V [Tropicimonas sp. IMCC34043]|uniref:phage baseplate assembly protein V n=1 Tax=Tropicimonas sp. IMCC34043 TaxID=2248760 RepID=UPI000E258146|nr:phage baseplate assembly protein V [Tropicimonas sp. IMCC34043]